MRRTPSLPILLVICLAAPSGIAQAQSKAGQGASGVGNRTQTNGRGAVVSGAVSGGYGSWMTFYGYGSPGGFFWYAPAGSFATPSGFMAAPVPVTLDRGPVAPPPPPGVFKPLPNQQVQAEPRPVARDSARAAQFVVLGDRLFRGKNLKKAEDRYLQAVRADSGAAAPLLRLAQIAMVREQYKEAARWLRGAEATQPGWIVTAPDVQALFAEPEDFAGHLSRLESYLQVHPEDRDGWLVLGAELFLSGRAARASDVFLRLNDPRRQPDVALSAFLNATNQH